MWGGIPMKSSTGVVGKILGGRAMKASTLNQPIREFSLLSVRHSQAALSQHRLLRIPSLVLLGREAHRLLGVLPLADRSISQRYILNCIGIRGLLRTTLKGG